MWWTRKLLHYCQKTDYTTGGGQLNQPWNYTYIWFGRLAYTVVSRKCAHGQSTFQRGGWFKYLMNSNVQWSCWLWKFKSWQQATPWNGKTPQIPLSSLDGGLGLSSLFCVRMLVHWFGIIEEYSTMHAHDLLVMCMDINCHYHTVKTFWLLQLCFSYLCCM